MSDTASSDDVFCFCFRKRSSSAPTLSPPPPTMRSRRRLEEMVHLQKPLSANKPKHQPVTYTQVLPLDGTNWCISVLPETGYLSNLSTLISIPSNLLPTPLPNPPSYHSSQPSFLPSQPSPPSLPPSPPAIKADCVFCFSDGGASTRASAAILPWRIIHSTQNKGTASENRKQKARVKTGLN